MSDKPTTLRELDKIVESIVKRAEQNAKEPLPPGVTRRLTIGEWVHRRMETDALNALAPDPLKGIRYDHD